MRELHVEKQIRGGIDIIRDIFKGVVTSARTTCRENFRVIIGLYQGLALTLICLYSLWMS